MARVGGVMVVFGAIAITLRFVAYLVFLGWVVVRTGSTEGLRDVATAINAYKRPIRATMPRQRTKESAGTEEQTDQRA